ncbi:MAG: hypothetical protein K940chlam9_01794 [Chlamydiae bacterium]|nr:hypothetical protein [Chlamydiota bacterium]
MCVSCFSPTFCENLQPFSGYLTSHTKEVKVVLALLGLLTIGGGVGLHLAGINAIGAWTAGGVFLIIDLAIHLAKPPHHIVVLHNNFPEPSKLSLPVRATYEYFNYSGAYTELETKLGQWSQEKKIVLHVIQQSSTGDAVLVRRANPVRSAWERCKDHHNVGIVLQPRRGYSRMYFSPHSISSMGSHSIDTKATWKVWYKNHQLYYPRTAEWLDDDNQEAKRLNKEFLNIFFPS